ncbi:MAG: hypothetical protein VW709_13875, partial [Rickettsiales bacterium]
MSDWAIAARFAVRELRAGVRGFRVLIACLALGVASVAGVGSVSSALKAGLKSEGRVLLGGDVDLAFTHCHASAEQLEWLRANTASISEITELRTMARRIGGGQQRLVELKGVDGNYPLYGGLKLLVDASLASLINRDGPTWGAAFDPLELDHLDLRLGDQITDGDSR